MRMQIKYDLLGITLAVVGQVILVSTLFSDRSETLFFGIVMDVLFVFSAVICVARDYYAESKFNPTRISLCRMNLDSVSARKSR